MLIYFVSLQIFLAGDYGKIEIKRKSKVSCLFELFNIFILISNMYLN